MTALAAARAPVPAPSPGERPGHRERLIAAMASSIEEKGYRETTVADVVRIARTSRRTFYEHFEDRDACFLALFDTTSDELIEHIAAAVNPADPWDAQIDQALGAYLEGMTARPALHYSFLRELPALGEAATARQGAVIERFAGLLVGLVESSRRRQPELGARPLAMDLAIMIVGGVRELVMIAAQQGRDVRELRNLASQAVKAILDAALLSRRR